MSANLIGEFLGKLLTRWQKRVAGEVFADISLIGLGGKESANERKNRSIKRDG